LRSSSDAVNAGDVLHVEIVQEWKNPELNLLNLTKP